MLAIKILFKVSWKQIMGQLLQSLDGVELKYTIYFTQLYTIYLLFLPQKIKTRNISISRMSFHSYYVSYS